VGFQGNWVSSGQIILSIEAYGERRGVACPLVVQRRAEMGNFAGFRAYIQDNMEQLGQDLRFAFRRLRKSTGFTAVVVLTLALGIGGNTAIFTLIHAVMLKSLPVADPQQLVRLGDRDACCVISGYQTRFAIFSSSLYEYLRDHTPEFADLAAAQADRVPLSVRRPGASEFPDSLVGEFVSGNYSRCSESELRRPRVIGGRRPAWRTSRCSD